MEFNIIERFKGIERIPKDAANAEQVGTSLFLTGHLGERIAPRLDEYAAKADCPRRDFLRSAFGLSAAMLAVNQVTGMWFFEVSEAEAYDPAAEQELTRRAEGGADFIVDVHSHICTRKDGYVKGSTRARRGCGSSSCWTTWASRWGSPTAPGT